MGKRGSSFISRFISILLIFAIVITGVLPQVAWAAPQTQFQTKGAKDAEPDFKPNKKPKPIAELKELRDQHSKHYLNDDGSRTLEVSPSSLHYKDSQGKWQDISNKLVSSDTEESTLSNEANDFKTYFAKNTANPHLLTIKQGQEYSVSWNLLDANKVKVVKSEESVLYPEIFSGIDLEYRQLADGVKENIILKTPGTSNYFTFRIKAKGVTPVLHKDNSIGFYANTDGEEPKEMKFSIPRPYMIDSNNEVSQLVTFQLKETDKKDEYELTIIADYDWLTDSKRVYPVTVDPLITTMVDSDVVTDTYVVENQPYQYYNSTYMTVGRDNVLNGRTRALVKMEAPVLPEGAIVTDAYFRMYKYTTTSNENEMIIARIKEGWNPNTLTWATLPSIDDKNEKTQLYVTKVPGDYTGWVDFNVWSIVKGWYGHQFSNHGFMIMNNTEGNPLSFFHATENGSRVPGLRITYITDPLGLNPYWGYANTAWGSVNTLSGNFLSSVTDFSLPGRGIPITVSRTYNSRGSLQGIFCNKWFSNLDMKLTHNSWGKVLTDSSGAERPFLLASDENSYIAPTNYPLQLYKNADGTHTLQEAYTNPGIIDRAEYKLKPELPSVTFNTEGKVTKLDDGKGNVTNITWNASSIVITDPSKRQVTINLEAANNLEGKKRATSIQDQDGVTKVTYSYDSADNLTKVTYLDSVSGDSSVRYEWLDGVITKYVDGNGTPIYLNYKDGQMVSIGAVNMLSNPSFEEVDAWKSIKPYLWEGIIENGNGSFTIDSSESPIHKYGKTSLKIEILPKSGMSGTSHLYAQQLVKVKPNQDYTLSAAIQTQGLEGNAFLQVRELKADKSHISWRDNRPGITRTNDNWTDSILNIKTSPETEYLMILAQVDYDHDPNEFKGVAYFDGIQLEEGTEKSKFFGRTDFREYIESTTQTTMVTSPSGEKVKHQNNKMGNPILIMNDVSGQEAKTIMSWDTSDRLRSIITPENQGLEGKVYKFEYDIVGNMTKALDPIGRETSYDYYYNHLQKTTLPDNKTVSSTWDPLNLTGVTSVDQSLNSKAYIYNGFNNLSMESNTLGVADNRVLNSNFEAGYDSKPSPVGINEPRFVDGKFGQALTIEKGTANRSEEMLTLPTGLFSSSQGLIEAWVKPLRNPDSSSSNNIQMIVDVAGTGTKGLALAIDQYGKFYIQAGTGTSNIKAFSTTTARKDSKRWNK